MLEKYYNINKIYINEIQSKYNKKLIFINNKLTNIYKPEYQFIEVHIKIYLDTTNSNNKYYLLELDEKFAKITILKL